MKLFSDAAEYGLRAVVWLADHPAQSWTVREIAAGTRSKPGYLVKVMQALARAGIVASQRGVGGGVSLAVDPGQVTILDVLNAVDPMARITTCPLRLKSHGTRLCSLHRRVDNAMAMIEAEFSQVTISDLLRDSNPSHPLCESNERLARLGLRRGR